METPTLIYCAGGNKQYADIAITAGYKYGSKLPETVYYPIYFADQDWKKPNRRLYMKYLEQYKPTVATVMDWEEEQQLEEVINWAEEASQFVEELIIIPKVAGGIPKLPRQINGKQVRLGYSVPVRSRPGSGGGVSKWGENTVAYEEFRGWPVHLLGGSPGQQKKISNLLNVISVDGNMHHSMATSRALFWVRGKKEFSNRWLSLKQADGVRWEGEISATYEAFRRSCTNIIGYWSS